MEIHLLMALKEVCMYNPDGDFDELLRDEENENASDPAICAVDAPIGQKIALDAQVMEVSEREAQSEVSATSQPSSFIKIYAFVINISDCFSSKMVDAYNLLCCNLGWREILLIFNTGSHILFVLITMARVFQVDPTKVLVTPGL